MPDEGLAPSLLLAMPQLDDPNFNRAVVLLCRHNDEGALGFIVNRPVHVTAKELLALEPPLETDTPLSVWEGGPVSQERGWLLCRQAPSDASNLEVCDGLFMSNSPALLRRILDGDPRNCEPDRSRLFLGYSGWGPAQLDNELATSSWLNAPLDLDMVFTTPPEDLWERAIRSLGVEPSAIAAAPGVH
jgi:putative transcriptional regulator